jgi:hypothetical protein
MCTTRRRSVSFARWRQCPESTPNWRTTPNHRKKCLFISTHFKKYRVKSPCVPCPGGLKHTAIRDSELFVDYYRWNLILHIRKACAILFAGLEFPFLYSSERILKHKSFFCSSETSDKFKLRLLLIWLTGQQEHAPRLKVNRRLVATSNSEFRFWDKSHASSKEMSNLLHSFLVIVVLSPQFGAEVRVLLPCWHSCLTWFARFSCCPSEPHCSLV